MPLRWQMHHFITEGNRKMKRIAIAGFLHESNTFSRIVTCRNRFQEGSVTFGDALMQKWTGTNHEIGGFIDGAKRFHFMPAPVMAASAVPGGIIQSETYNELADELIKGLSEALPIDGLLLALHGSAVAENFRDADGELASRVRKFLGP